MSDPEAPEALSMPWLYLPSEEEARAAWDRAARWGARAETLLVDWMIGASDRWEELRAMTRVSNPEMLEAARAGGRGVLLAAAHVGPLLAIPAGLIVDADPFEWIASSGRWDESPLSRSLISTTGLPASEVSRRLYAGLRDGKAIMYAVDGDDRPTTPTRVVEGLVVPEVPLAPTMVWAAKATSLFVASRWVEEKVVITFSPMPEPKDSADSKEFAAAWGDAYYDHVRAYLLDAAPENMRLRGGIWSRCR